MQTREPITTPVYQAVELICLMGLPLAQQESFIQGDVYVHFPKKVVLLLSHISEKNQFHTNKINYNRARFLNKNNYDNILILIKKDEITQADLNETTRVHLKELLETYLWIQLNPQLETNLLAERNIPWNNSRDEGNDYFLHQLASSDPAHLVSILKLFPKNSKILEQVLLIQDASGNNVLHSILLNSHSPKKLEYFDSVYRYLILHQMIEKVVNQKNTAGKNVLHELASIDPARLVSILKLFLKNSKILEEVLLSQDASGNNLLRLILLNGGDQDQKSKDFNSILACFSSIEILEKALNQKNINQTSLLEALILSPATPFILNELAFSDPARLVSILELFPKNSKIFERVLLSQEDVSGNNVLHSILLNSHSKEKLKHFQAVLDSFSSVEILKKALDQKNKESKSVWDLVEEKRKNNKPFKADTRKIRPANVMLFNVLEDDAFINKINNRIAALNVSKKKRTLNFCAFLRRMFCCFGPRARRASPVSPSTEQRSRSSASP